MAEVKHTPGPWFFQAHNLYGSPVFEEGDEPWPFGYVSHNVQGTIARPIFALSPFMMDDASELLANAKMMAAAPDMLAALVELRDWYTEFTGLPAVAANAAIAKAEGK